MKIKEEDSSSESQGQAEDYKVLFQHQHEDDLRAKRGRKEKTLAGKLGSRYQRIVVAYWRIKDGLVDDKNKAFIRTDDEVQQDIVKWLEGNKHKERFSEKFFPKKEVSHHAKFSLLNENDSEDDQLDDLAELEKSNENEKAILHYTQVYRHIDKLQQIFEMKKHIDVKGPLMTYLMELEA
jgi:hypothetical protein